MHHNLTLATPSSAESGRPAFYLSDAEPFGGDWGFRLFDGAKKPLVVFLYSDMGHAVRGREAMFLLLKGVEGIVVAQPKIAEIAPENGATIIRLSSQITEAS